MSTNTDTTAEAPTESLDDFRARLRTWLAATMPRIPSDTWNPLEDDDDHATEARHLQGLLFKGGFAGICYPKKYGGQGLPIEYQKVFNEEASGYKMPVIFSTPTMSICGPTILDCATEEQRMRYIPKFLSGEELWVQFMSEPSGGSDMAGALTTATRDGDIFLLNGSKIWSTYAYRADYALCLARTDWSVPKHRGLTMFVVPIHHPKTTIQQIEMIDGTKEFCQEFFDDVDIPVDNVIGQINDGWTIASRLLFHEKSAVGGASPYVSVPFGRITDDATAALVKMVKARGIEGDPVVRRKVGRFETLGLIQDGLNERIRQGLKTKYFPDQAGAIARLYGGIGSVERTTIRYELAGDDALVYDADNDESRRAGVMWLQRQGGCIGGGTTEMARNVISERILRMPRELAPDKEIPFSEVRRNK